MKERNIKLPPLNHHQLTIFPMICLHLTLLGFVTKSQMRRVSHLKGEMLTCLIWVKVWDWMQENIMTNILVRWPINPMPLGFGWRCDVNITWVVVIIQPSLRSHDSPNIMMNCFFWFWISLLNPLFIMKERDKALCIKPPSTASDLFGYFTIS